MTVEQAKEILKNGLKSNSPSTRQMYMLALQILANSWGKNNGQQQDSNTTGG